MGFPFLLGIAYIGNTAACWSLVAPINDRVAEPRTRVCDACASEAKNVDVCHLSSTHFEMLMIEKEQE
jgi:hypothetical protein